MSKGKDADGAPFVVKTYQLLHDKGNKDLVGWSEAKDSFVVWNPVDFASEVLPKYFKHNNFCSFIRQLNTYGFHKVESKQWEFKHELFREGRTDLLKQISRRKSKKRDEREISPIEEHSPQENDFSPPVAKDTKMARVDKDDKEVGKLQELNNLLMREVIRLQQQQESTNDTIKQILSELITSRKEQTELTKKVSEIATDPKETTSKPPTPVSSPITPSTPSSVISSPAYSGRTPESQSLFSQIVVPKTEQINVQNYLDNAMLQHHIANHAKQPLMQNYPIATTQVQYPMHVPSTPSMYAQYGLNTPQHVDYQAQVTNLGAEPILESFLNQDDSNFFNLDDLAQLELAPPEQTASSTTENHLERNYQVPDGYVYNLQ